MQGDSSKVMPYDYLKVETYAGYYKDNIKLKHSASGGATSIFAENIIAKGGVVFGVVYSNDFKSAHYSCENTLEGIERFKGSKYIMPEPFIFSDEIKISVYEAVANKLKEGVIVLFVGTGCYVGALKKYIEKNKISDSQLITVDLICHGPTFSEVEKQYIQRIEEKYKSKVINFSVRYKKEGWRPPYIHAVFENGKVYDKPFYETEFGYAFKILSKEACFSCHFKGDNHVSDITVGDFWGVKKNSEEYNDNGVSIIFSRSQKGQALIDEVDQKKFFLKKVETEKAAEHNRMFYESREKPKEYKQFKDNFETKGLYYAVKHSSGYYNFLKMVMKRALKRKLPTYLLKLLDRYKV